MEGRIRQGQSDGSVSTTVQVIRIGKVAMVGLPGEPFNEIGRRIKDRSPAGFTICCGYTNDAVGYIPTREEHQYGGYEVSLSHRHYGHPSPLAVGCDHLLERSARILLTRLFGAAH